MAIELKGLTTMRHFSASRIVGEEEQLVRLQDDICGLNVVTSVSWWEMHGMEERPGRTEFQETLVSERWKKIGPDIWQAT